MIAAVRRSTSRNSSARVAPSASRMPNSCRRCATPWAITPYRPTHARTTATIARIPRSRASESHSARDRATASAIDSTGDSGSEGFSSLAMARAFSAIGTDPLVRTMIVAPRHMPFGPANS